MRIAGPLYGSFISRFVNWPMPPEENEPTLTKGNLPSFGFSLALVLCPLVLVGMNRRAAGHPGFAAAAVAGIGHPFTAIPACLIVISTARRNRAA